jgi:hypothetical protein
VSLSRKAFSADDLGRAAGLLAPQNVIFPVWFSFVLAGAGNRGFRCADCAACAILVFSETRMQGSTRVPIRM